MEPRKHRDHSPSHDHKRAYALDSNANTTPNANLTEETTSFNNTEHSLNQHHTSSTNAAETVKTVHLKIIRLKKDSSSKELSLEENYEKFVEKQSELKKKPTPTFAEVSLKEFGCGPYGSMKMESFYTSLGSSVRKLVAKDELADVVIHIGKYKYRCHSILLLCISNYFEQCNRFKNIVLPKANVSAKAFAFIYDCYLNVKLGIKRDLLSDVFKTARFLEATDMEQICWQYVDDKSRFNEDTACQLYLESKDDLIMEPMPTLIQRRVQKFYLSLVATSEFVELTLEQIISFMQSRNIHVNSELDMFLSAVRWLSHNWTQRKQHAVTVFQSICMSQLPRIFLVHLVKGIQCRTLSLLLDEPDILNFLQRSLAESRLFESFCNKCTKLNDFDWSLREFEIQAPIRHFWITDANCVYSKLLEDPYQVCNIYTSFLEYLQVVRSGGRLYWKTLE